MTRPQRRPRSRARPSGPAGPSHGGDGRRPEGSPGSLQPEARPRGSGRPGPSRGNGRPRSSGPVGSGKPDDQRRALSHVGGKVFRLFGSPAHQRLIRSALRVDPQAGVRDHVHGFHAYPARLHPATARRLIEGLCPAGGLVADPFCGSGTVPVEARWLGRRAFGSDLNPLAVHLARFKANPLAQAERKALLESAARANAHAEDRRQRGAGPTRRYPEEQRQQFDPHILLELDGLADGIEQEPDKVSRRGLWLALSSMLNKVSRPGGPAAEPHARGTKRLASGFAIRFFLARVEEMCRQLSAFEAELAPGTPEALCRIGDARKFDDLGQTAVDLVVSSPPYPGVLDYAHYHWLRLQWLGLPGERFAGQEIGSRRQLQPLPFEQAARQWEGDFGQVLKALARALSPSGVVALVLADTSLAGVAYGAREMATRCAARAGLAVVAGGCQERPHFHLPSEVHFGQRPRCEHLLLLQRSLPGKAR